MAAPGQPPVASMEGTKEELDSVDAEFGNEYSEATLEVVRDVPKMPYLEESSSLDPVDDLEQYVENQVGLAPQVYDALQEFGQEQVQDLQAAVEYQAPPQETDAVRYRQQLAEGTSHEDMTWLKLRAYHRAMNALQQEQVQQQQQEQQERLQAYEVPVDKVPADLLHLSPAQLAERRKLSLLAGSKAARAAAQRQSAVQRILSQPDPSEESEWDLAPSTEQQQQQQQAVASDYLQGIRQALQQHTGLLQLLPTPQQPAAAAAAEGQEAQVQEEQAPAAAAQPRQQRQLRTVYTQAYLEKQALEARLQRQAQQRSQAFWLSFLTVSGAYIVRAMRRRLLKKPTGKTAAKAGKPGSSTSLASSKQLQAA